MSNESEVDTAAVDETADRATLTEAVIPLSPQDLLAALCSDDPAHECEVLEREAASEGDPAQCAILFCEVARLLELAGDTSEAAQQRYQRAFELDLRLRPACWAICRPFERAGDWLGLLRFTNDQIALAPTDARRIELLVERGHLLAHKFADEPGARQSFEEALRADPVFLPALVPLEKIVARENNPKALAALYGQLATATYDPARRVYFLLDLARLQEASPESGPPEAFATLAKAWKVDAARELILDEWQRMATRVGQNDVVLDVLERRIRLLVHESIEEERPRDMAALRRQQAAMVAVYDPARAWNYLAPTLTAVPDEPLLLLDTRDLALRLEDHEAAAKLLDQLLNLAPAASQPALRLFQARALREAGQVEAASMIEKELDDHPVGTWLALCERQVDAITAEDSGALPPALEREGELASATAEGAAPGPHAAWAAAAWAAAGVLHEHHANEAEACAAYQKALAIEPGQPTAFEGLNQVYRRAGRHAERLVLLERELARRDGSIGPFGWRISSIYGRRFWGFRGRLPCGRRAGSSRRERFSYARAPGRGKPGRGPVGGGGRAPRTARRKVCRVRDERTSGGGSLAARRHL